MKKKQVLVVEDEADIALLIKRSLSVKNIKVFQAGSASSALEILDNLIPDLILLDVLMPDMDGFELCRQIKLRKKLANVPVVFLTVRTSRQDEKRGLEAGGILYLTKPFDPFILGEELERILFADASS